VWGTLNCPPSSRSLDSTFAVSTTRRNKADDAVPAAPRLDGGRKVNTRWSPLRRPAPAPAPRVSEHHRPRGRVYEPLPLWPPPGHSPAHHPAIPTNRRTRHKSWCPPPQVRIRNRGPRGGSHRDTPRVATLRQRQLHPHRPAPICAALARRLTPATLPGVRGRPPMPGPVSI